MKETQKVLLGVVRNVLERFTFMFCETDDEKRFADCQGPFLYASVTFSGSRQAMISLTAPESLCLEMAANILGADPSEIDAEAGVDAIKELVNVVCGELIPALYGDKEVFDLTVPSAYRIDTGKWLELVAVPENMQLWVEDRPVLASLALAGDSRT
jgi:CheY-specific phosphatase CheX